MKKIKMLKTMACEVMTAHEGQILNVENEFANQLLKANACEILEDIIDVVDYVEVEETVEPQTEPQIEPQTEPQIEPQTEHTSKNRKK